MLILERVAGIEPAYSAWKAAVLPLYYTRAPWPARQILFVKRVVGEAGLEPAKAYASGFTVRPLCHSGHSPSASSTKLPVLRPRSETPYGLPQAMLRKKPQVHFGAPKSERVL